MALQYSDSLTPIIIPEAGAQEKTAGHPKGKASPLDAATVDRIVAEEGAGALKPTVLGIYGQESGSGTNARTSTDGAIGGMQVIPATFSRLAKPGERIDNPEDNFRVGVRYLKRMSDQFGVDPARLAVGYFSGEGNVNPSGDTPYKVDKKDGNGKTVSSYVRDLVARVGGAVASEAKAAEPAPDISKAPKYRDFIAKPQWAGLDDSQKTQARDAYFDRYVAPHLAPAERDSQREAFLQRAAQIEGLGAAGASEPDVFDRIKTGAAEVGGAVMRSLRSGADSSDGASIDPTALAAPSDESSKIGVMGSARAPESASTSQAPVTQKFRDEFGRAYDAATPEQRQQMAQDEGVVGQLARERAGLADSLSTGEREVVDRAQAQLTQPVPAGTISPIQGPAPTTGSVASGLANSLYSGAIKTRAGLRAAVADAVGSGAGQEAARREVAGAQLLDSTTTPAFESPTAAGIYSGAASALQNIPAVAAAIATRNPAIATGTMVAPMLPQQYGVYREAGATPAQAGLGAAAYAASEYLTERMPMGVLVNKFGRVGATRFIADLLAKELPSEQVATLAQDAIDQAVTQPDKTWGEYLRERPGAAYQTLLATLTQSALMGGASAGVNAVNRAAERNAAEGARDQAMNKAAAFAQPRRPKHASTAAAEQVVREMAAEAGLDPAELLSAQRAPTEAAAPSPPSAALESVSSQVGTGAAPAPAEPAANPAPAQMLATQAAPSSAPTPITEISVPTAPAYDPRQVLDFAQTRYERLVAKRDGEALVRMGEDGQPVDGEIAGQKLTPEEQREIVVIEQSRGDARALAHFYGFDEDQNDGSASAVPAEPVDPRGVAPDAGMGVDPAAGRAGPVQGGDGGRASAAPAGVAGADVVPGADGAADGQSALTAPSVEATQSLDAAAHEAATSPHNDLPEPTEAQKQAGNYRLGHVSLHGLDISIENPRGSTRSGTDADGKAWSVEMANHYGYLKRSTAADGDHVDVFIGDHPDSTKVFVVDQVDPRTGRYDEAKVLLGFSSLKAAREGYLANYEQGWKGAGAITPMSMDQFKSWLKEGDTTKPMNPKVGKPKTEKQAKAAREAAKPATPRPAPRTEKQLRAERAEAVPAAKGGKLGDSPLLKRATHPGRIAAEDLRAKFAPIIKQWTNGPKGGVEIVQSVDDLPARLAANLRAAGEDGRAQGFYLPKSDKVYLIADNLPSLERAQEVVFHEVYGHKGMRAILPGEQYAEMMGRIRRANPKIAAAARTWFDDYGDSTIEMNMAAGQSAAEARSNAKLLSVEEALADMAATVPVAGPVRKLLAALQDGLRKIGLHAVADWLEGKSEAETFALLRDARADVFGREQKEGDSVASPGESAATPVFARTRDNAQMNLFRLFQDGKEKSVDTMGRWDRTVGTQYNKALKDEHYGTVFGYALALQNEISMASIRPAELAPALLHKVDGFKPALRALVLGRKRDKELEGATQAIFAGSTAGETVAQGRVWSDDDLRSRFGLTDRGIGLYKQARMAINASLDEVAAAEAYAMSQGFVPKGLRRTVIDDPAAARGVLLGSLDQQIRMLERATKAAARGKSEQERIETLESVMKPYLETRDKLEEIFEQAASLKTAGYAPLMRFGRYTVYANEVGANGEVLRDENDDPKSLYFGIFETEAEAIRKADELRKQYADHGNVRVSRGKKDQKGSELFSGISPETVALFGDIVGQDEATKKFYQQALSERSALKRRLGRRVVAGYSTDLPRILSNFITSNGRLAAQRYYLRDLNNAIRTIPKAKGDVKDEAIALRNYMLDANDAGSGASSLMFAYFLGGSVASAAVNITQPLMMTAPYLSQWGAGRAAAAMTKAMPYALGKKEITDTALRAALRRGSQEGVVEAQEIFHLYSQGAQTVSTSIAAKLARLPTIGKGLQSSTESARARLEGFFTLWGSMFAAAESFNRKLTFVAAWEVARANKDADPYEFAARAVNETQGIFNKVNRPNWARSTPGRLLMTFKQFSIMYLELTRRMWRAGPQGKRAVLMMMAVLFLAAGEEGLPFAQDINDLVDTIGQRLGYDTNLLRNKRKWAHRILGKTAGDFALYGVSSMLPLDFQGRLGMGNLIPGTGLLKPAEAADRSRDVTDVIGPAGALVSTAMDSYDAWSAKQPGRAVMALMPKAVNNAAAGLEMAVTGTAKDYKGRKVTDVGLGDAVVKGLGFTPTKVAEDTRRRMPARQDIALAKKVQGDIVDLWTRGLAEGDKGMQESAAAWLNDWNEKNPESPITITSRQLVSRVKQMATPSADRMLKGAPKALRGRLAGELATAEDD